MKQIRWMAIGMAVWMAVCSGGAWMPAVRADAVLAALCGGPKELVVLLHTRGRPGQCCHLQPDRNSQGQRAGTLLVPESPVRKTS